MSLDNGMVTQNIRRGADGLWLIKDDDGDEIRFEFNAAVSQIASNELQLRLTKNLASIKTSDAHTKMELRNDAVRFEHDAGKVLIGKDSTTLVRGLDGTQEVIYPNGVSLKTNDKREIVISSEARAKFPEIEISSDGLMTARGDDYLHVARKRPDGSQEIVVSDMLSIRTTSNGNIVLRMSSESGVTTETFTIYPDGRARNITTFHGIEQVPQNFTVPK